MSVLVASIINCFSFLLFPHRRRLTVFQRLQMTSILVLAMMLIVARSMLRSTTRIQMIAKINQRSNQSIRNSTAAVSHGPRSYYRYMKELYYPIRFPYTILKTDICTKYRPNTNVIVVVHTAPENSDRRQFIRSTYGNTSLKVKANITVVFMVGKPDPSSIEAAQIDVKLQRESESYGDIIQSNFIDTYRNLTHKGVMWMKWVSKYCNKAQYVLKIDDDIIVNTFLLADHILHMTSHDYGAHNTISCLMWTNVKPLRKKKSKWYVTRKEYANSVYPPYCSGAAVILSMDLIKKMLIASKVLPFFWVDDVYIFGILAKKVNANFHQMASAYLSKDEWDKMIDRHALFTHMADLPERTKLTLWKRVIDNFSPRF